MKNNRILLIFLAVSLFSIIVAYWPSSFKNIPKNPFRKTSKGVVLPIEKKQRTTYPDKKVAFSSATINLIDLSLSEYPAIQTIDAAVSPVQLLFQGSINLYRGNLTIASAIFSHLLKNHEPVYVETFEEDFKTRLGINALEGLIWVQFAKGDYNTGARLLEEMEKVYGDEEFNELLMHSPLYRGRAGGEALEQLFHLRKSADDLGNSFSYNIDTSNLFLTFPNSKDRYKNSTISKGASPDGLITLLKDLSAHYGPMNNGDEAGRVPYTVTASSLAWKVVREVELNQQEWKQVTHPFLTSEVPNVIQRYWSEIFQARLNMTKPGQAPSFFDDIGSTLNGKSIYFEREKYVFSPLIESLISFRNWQDDSENPLLNWEGKLKELFKTEASNLPPEAKMALEFKYGSILPAVFSDYSLSRLEGTQPLARSVKEIDLTLFSKLEKDQPVTHFHPIFSPRYGVAQDSLNRVWVANHSGTTIFSENGQFIDQVNLTGPLFFEKEKDRMWIGWGFFDLKKGTTEIVGGGNGNPPNLLPIRMEMVKGRLYGIYPEGSLILRYKESEMDWFGSIYFRGKNALDGANYGEGFGVMASEDGLFSFEGNHQAKLVNPKKTYAVCLLGESGRTLSVAEDGFYNSLIMSNKIDFNNMTPEGLEFKDVKGLFPYKGKVMIIGKGWRHMYDPEQYSLTYLGGEDQTPNDFTHFFAGQKQLFFTSTGAVHTFSLDEGKWDLFVDKKSINTPFQNENPLKVWISGSSVFSISEDGIEKFDRKEGKVHNFFASFSSKSGPDKIFFWDNFVIHDSILINLSDSSIGQLDLSAGLRSKEVVHVDPLPSEVLITTQYEELMASTTSYFSVSVFDRESGKLKNQFTIPFKPKRIGFKENKPLVLDSSGILHVLETAGRIFPTSSIVTTNVKDFHAAQNELYVLKQEGLTRFEEGEFIPVNYYTTQINGDQILMAGDRMVIWSRFSNSLYIGENGLWSELIIKDGSSHIGIKSLSFDPSKNQLWGIRGNIVKIKIPLENEN